MKRAPFLLAILIFGLLLTSCSQDTTTLRPTPPPFEGVEEAVALSLATVDPEENLHLFDYDQQAPLDIQEVACWREGSATWYDINYVSPLGGRVPATLIVPDGRGPFAGVILMHGSGCGRQGLYRLGEVYAGFGSVVIIIDAPFCRPDIEHQSELVTWKTERDRKQHIQLIVDLRRTVDVLIARPEVDPDRLAYVGRSYGGAMGGLLAGVEDRLQAYVLMVGDGGLVEHTSKPDEQGYPEHWHRPWAEAMWPVEPLHFVGRASPAALLFQNGLQDSLVPPSDAARYHEAASEPKMVLWYDAGHDLPSQVYRDQISWLQLHIGDDLSWMGASYRGSALALDRLMGIWFFLTIGALGWFLWESARAPISWGLWLGWVLVTVLFGPLGLLAFLFSHRRRARGLLTYSVLGGAMAWVLVIVFFACYLPSLGLAVVLAALYVALLIIGLLAFRVLVVSKQDGRFHLIARRPLPAEVIWANLAFPGAFPLALLAMSGPSPETLRLSDPGFWLITLLAVVVGALVLDWLDAHLAAQEENAVAASSLRSGRAAHLLSFALLIASLGLLMLKL
jgi:dienelactone hydrolase